MSKLNSFARAEGGNIAILFAFTLSLLVLFSGAAVDFTRRNAVRADLIESLDAAGLAIAQLNAADKTLTDDQLRAYGEEFFLENFQHEDLIIDLDVDFELDPQTIRPKASGRIKTLILGAAGPASGGLISGYEYLSMETSTEITRRGSGPIELALVLDVTGSMANNVSGGSVKKIQSLRDASDALLDVLFGEDETATSENVRVSVVPFNAYVNAGGAVDKTNTKVWQNAWNDSDAKALYHGARFMHVTSTGAVDPSVKVNHFDLFNSNAALNWKGCTEAKPFPLDEIDMPVGAEPEAAIVTNYDTAPPGSWDSTTLDAFSAAPGLTIPLGEIVSINNSRFVPLFHPDDPNCNSGSNLACGYTSLPTAPNPSTRTGIAYSGGWFDNPASDSPPANGYGNSYVNDKAYVRDNTVNTDRYVTYINYVRSLTRNHFGGSCGGAPQATGTDTAFAAFLQAQGATDSCNDEYIMRTAYPGRYDDANKRYVGKYDLSVSIDETISEASGDTTTRGPNRNCSDPILYNSDAKKPVRDHIHALAPAGNTNSAEGMMWGWRVLSPETPFASDIPYRDGRWQKAVVLMTDGNNVVSTSETHWKSAHSAYGYAIEERMGDGLDTQAEMEAEIDNKLLRICARMKAESILVYTITFGLSDTGAEGDTKKVFKSCATEPQAPYYFDAPDGEDLEEAFTDIAADLTKLHVSR